MSFLKRKNILFYSLIILLFSCKKDVHIHIPDRAPRLVINCLFNPDSNWKVFVGESSALEDTSVSTVKHAHVSISGDNHSILLTYLDSGFYGSDIKPQTGIQYTVKVSAQGFHPVEATSRIPVKLSIASYTFDTIPVTIQTDADIINFDKTRVNKLILSIDGMNRNSYAQLQTFSYNKNELYDYTITDSTLSRTLAELKNDHSIYIDIPAAMSDLSKLKGKAILSETGFRDTVNATVGADARYLVDKVVVKYAKRTPHVKHLESLFMVNEIYAQQFPFYNIGEDYFSAFFEKENHIKKNKFILFTDHYPFDPIYSHDPLKIKNKGAVEIWVDLYSLSSAAFQFKTTFIKQQLNRGNPFAQPVQVYSNIKGGLGIFAGYQFERVRVY